MAATPLRIYRKRAPPEPEWSRIREKLERLYVHENVPLPKISQILAEEDNFHAE
jgi:hypothetical protein